MAKRFRSSSRSPRRAAPVPATVAPPNNSATIWLIIGVIGWILAAVCLGIMLRNNSLHQQRMKKLQATLPARIKAIQAQAEVQKQEVHTQQSTVVEQLNTANAEQSKLLPEVQKLTKKLLAKQQNQAALEKTIAELDQQIKAARDKANAAGRLLSAGKAELAKKEALKSKLMRRYRRRYQVMRDDLRERLKKGSAPQLRIFYYSRRHTPFAPCAGFYAAELYYKLRKSADALKIYQDIVERFGDSPYAGPAQERIAQIQARKAYADEEVDDPGFQPYKALSFVR